VLVGPTSERVFDGPFATFHCFWRFQIHGVSARTAICRPFSTD
jgi:hypothetical protein